MSEEIRVAIINLKTGLVENIAVMKEGDGSAAPDGFLMFASDDAAIGDSFDGNAIVKPEPVAAIADAAVEAERPGGLVAEPATPSAVSRDEFDALSARVAVLEARAGV